MQEHLGLIYGWNGLRNRKMSMRQGHGMACGARDTAPALGIEKT